MLTSKRFTLALGLPILAVLGATQLAHAQAGGPGMGGPPGGPGGPGGEDDEEKGTAEKAPEDALAMPTVTTLPPYPGEREKAFQLLTFDGYFRLRTGWMRNYHLGFLDQGNGTPFPRSLSCFEGTTANASTCGKTIGTANMRLRFEPTVHLSEKVALKMQLDVLDNVVLGSTTEGVFFDGTASPDSQPIDAFAQSQEPPEAGRNALSDSIRVKRVWAEIQTPLGLLKFGRMPVHFGLGIRDNAGAGLDDDYGDTVDRVVFSRGIPGTDFTASVAMGWGGNGPTSAQLFTSRQQGQPWDVDDADDVTEYVAIISKLDDEDTWKAQIADGEAAFNWGVTLTFRKQPWEIRDSGATEDPALTAQFQPRDATLYVPDAYLRFGVGKFNLAAEFVAVLGSIGHLDDVDGDPATEGVQGIPSADVRQFGGVLRLNYLFVNDELDLGLELGFASGDQWEATKQGEVDYRGVPTVPRSSIDNTASAFLFDPAYQVDFILFRSLLGTVRNATYVKPKLSWDISPRVRLAGWAVVSFANVPVATPGNGGLWGVELDTDLAYHNDDEGFTAGISYGLLLPLAAMDHPSALYANPAEQGDAGNAHAIKMRLALTF